MPVMLVVQSEVSFYCCLCMHYLLKVEVPYRGHIG